MGGREKETAHEGDRRTKGTYAGRRPAREGDGARSGDQWGKSPGGRETSGEADCAG